MSLADHRRKHGGGHACEAIGPVPPTGGDPRSRFRRAGGSQLGRPSDPCPDTPSTVGGHPRVARPAKSPLRRPPL
jgi:hypothetical protein